MKAAHHPFEAARLATLRAYDILDTPRESDFDEIVDLAARICGVPISVINLIDEGRQWFKAETGLGVRETPLDTSMCAHVILEEGFVEIPDTLADPRMSDNPLCLADPGLRFYAGALLKAKNGLPIGTLCVLDNQPRVLNDLQRDALKVLANQIMSQLDLRAFIANEKILRSEIDHRVKNSLQTVSGFVSLERGATADDETRAAMDRVAQQIDTVALLHEFLGSEGDGQRVDLGSYLDRVVGLIDRALPGNIAVKGSFAAIQVEPREASTVGTIVNELVANGFKHSFGEAGGTITLVGQSTGGRAYNLECRDDAKSPKMEVLPGRREGLGLRILNASVRQLGGTMNATRDESGYRTRLDFRFAGD